MFLDVTHTLAVFGEHGGINVLEQSIPPQRRATVDAGHRRSALPQFHRVQFTTASNGTGET